MENIEPNLSQAEPQRNPAEQQPPEQHPIESASGNVLVTVGLIVACVATFLVMVVRGVNAFSPDTASLISWGANLGPLTTGGQQWRLLSAMFLHGGLLHLALNMAVLLQIGSFLERVFGSAAFFTVYVFSGICGGIATILWSPYVASVGASGAIFGLYGALLSFLFIHRRTIPGEVLMGLLKPAAIFVGFNLLNSFRPGVDMAAHIGGLCGGLAAGLILSLPVMRAVKEGSRMPRAAGAAAAGILAVMAINAMPAVRDVEKEVTQMIALEGKVVRSFNDSLQRLQAGTISEAEAVRIMNAEVVSPWRSQRDALLSFNRLASQQKTIVDRLTHYMSLRLDGWELCRDGIANNDLKLVERGNQKHAEAMKLADKAEDQ